MKTKDTKYEAFDLSIKSEIPLLELDQLNCHGGPADIEIIVQDLSKLWNRLSDTDSTYVVSENHVMFQAPNVAIFSIQNGNRITVSPMTGGDEDKIRLYILGTCMGALLMQRKTLPLHGSAVVANGRVYSFVGERGAGKSTIAAAFLRKGFPLITDDVIAVSLDRDEVPYVIPSYPQQKLWQESLDQLGMESSGYRPLFERETKYAIPVHHHFSTKPLPLAGVFELIKGDGNQIEVQPIWGLEKLAMLYRHTYRNFLIKKSGLLDWHFQFTTKVASQANLFRLQRPASGFTAHELVSRVLEDLNKEVSINDYKAKSFVK